MQDCRVVLVVKGSQAGGIEVEMEDALAFAEVEGGGLLSADERGRTELIVQSGVGAAGE